MRLSHTRRAQQDDVLGSLDKAQSGDLLDLLSRHAHRKLEGAAVISENTDILGRSLRNEGRAYSLLVCR